MGKGFSVFLILAIGTAVIAMVFFLAFPGAMSIENNQIQVISSSAMLAYLVLALINRKTSAALVVKQIALWLGIFLVVITGYSFKTELSTIYNKVTANLLPYKAEVSSNTARFVKSSNGHFIIEVQTDGIPINFMVDTGASRVVLSQYDAQALGIDIYNLNYNQQVSTANGTTWTATVCLKEMRVGNIITTDVLASVSKSNLEQSLLGMSFLERVKSYSIEGDVLTLRN